MAEYDHSPQDLDDLRNGLWGLSKTIPQEEGGEDLGGHSPSDVEDLRKSLFPTHKIVERAPPMDLTSPASAQDVFMQGVLLGYEPEIGAGLQTFGQYLRGEPTDYQAALEQERKGLTKAQEVSPIAATGLEIAGSTPSVLVPIGAGARALGTLGRVSGVSRGLGALGEANKLTRWATPGVTGLTKGAVEGAAAGALTNKLTPQDFWTDVAWGAGIGGPVGMALGVAFPGVREFSKAALSPQTASRAATLQAHGVEPMAHQLVEGTDTAGRAIIDAAKRLEVTGGTEQLGQLTQATAELVGMDAATMQKLGVPKGVISPGFSSAAKANLGKVFDLVESKVPDISDQILNQNINGVMRQARQAPISWKAQNAINSVANNISRDISTGTLTGKAYRGYVQKGGDLDLLLKHKNPHVQQAGIAIKKSLDDALERAAYQGRGLTPNEVAQYKTAKGQYRNLMLLDKVIDDAQQTGGLVSPMSMSRLAGESGQVGDLARATSLLKDTRPTAQGGVAMPGRNRLLDAGKKVAEVLGSGGLGYLIPSALTGSPDTISALAAAGATGATRFLREHNLRNLLEGSDLTNRLLNRAGVLRPVGPETSIQRDLIVPGAVGAVTQTREDRE